MPFAVSAFLWAGSPACVVQTAPAPEPPESEAPITEAAPQGRRVQLEDGRYVDIVPGLESGFAHCCGDEEHMLEVECSDMLVRCYEKQRGRWKQTFGRHCKDELTDECYTRTCHYVCEAHAMADEMQMSTP